jgi:hypothetical protein
LENRGCKPLPSPIDVDCKRIVIARDDVNDTVVDERLRLVRASRPDAGTIERSAPDRSQAVDVLTIEHARAQAEKTGGKEAGKAAFDGEQHAFLRAVSRRETSMSAR